MKQICRFGCSHSCRDSLHNRTAVDPTPLKPPKVQGKVLELLAIVSGQLYSPRLEFILSSKSQNPLSASSTIENEHFWAQFNSYKWSLHLRRQVILKFLAIYKIPDRMGVLLTGTWDSSRPASMTVGLISGTVVELKVTMHSTLSRFWSSSLHER